MRYFMGLDIGGTNIKYGVINERGELMSQSSSPTGVKDGIPSLVSRVGEIIRKLKGDYPVSGIGISTAGVVDTITGEIIHSGPTIPDYQGTNLKSLLEKEFKIPVLIDNDVNAAALGEAWMGAGKSLDTFFCLTLGTGIGGAVVINRQLFRGKNFRSGEIGYMGKQNGMDKPYEQKAATSVLVANAQQELNIEEIDGKAIFEKARAGEPQCKKIVQEWIQEIAKGVANVICVLDPGVVIIGGAVSQQGIYLLNRIEDSLRSLLPNVFVDSTRFMTAECGNTAGLLGAVYPFVK